jgi:hypothetical protein
MNMNSITSLSSLSGFFTDHYLITAILAIFLFGFGVNAVTYLHQKLNFYIWYFVAILIVLLWALKTSVPNADPRLEVDHMLYFYAFMLGMTTAFAEIIGKFSDEPIKSLRTPHALFYHLLNGAISAFALFALKTFGTKPILNSQEKLQIVLIAGLGAMFVMRSKLFNLKIGGQDVALGPEQLINVFFSFMEDAIDRVRAQSRIEFIRDLHLSDADFDKLRDYSLSMLRSAQAISLEEMNKYSDDIAKLRSLEGDPALRSYALGFLLLNRMGEDFVRKILTKPLADIYFRAPVPYQQTETGLLDKLAGQLSAHNAPAATYYMAYGDNINARAFRERMNWADMEETEFAARCQPRPCKLSYHQLVFNKPFTPEANDPTNVLGWPNIEKTATEADVVEGILYKLSDETLRFIDRTEVGYVRKEVEVEVLADGKKTKMKAQVYTAAGESTRPGLPPDPACLQKMLDGARGFNLDAQYIANLEHTYAVAKAQLAAQKAMSASAAQTTATTPAPATPAPAGGGVMMEAAAELVAAVTTPAAEAGGNGTHPPPDTP